MQKIVRLSIWNRLADIRRLSGDVLRTNLTDPGQAISRRKQTRRFGQRIVRLERTVVLTNIEPGPALAGTYDLRDYRYFRDRSGVGGTLDYRFNDTSTIYLKGLYSHFNNFGDDWIYSPAINNFVTPLQGDATGSVSFQALRRRPVQDIGGLQLGGHHVLRRSILAWDLNSSVARTRDEGYSTAHFSPVSATNPLNNVQYGLDLRIRSNRTLTYRTVRKYLRFRLSILYGTECAVHVQS